RQLGRDEATIFPLKGKEVPEGAVYCSFLLPRTVCRREITREEAQVYLRDAKTALLTDFISQRGRPFSATLVLRETGRHGFEFPPRGGAAAAEAGEGGEAGQGAKKGARQQRAGGRKKAPAAKAGKAAKAAKGGKGGKATKAEKAASKPEKATEKAAEKT